MIMKYLHSRRSCKPSVPVQETTAEKRSFSTHFFISAQSSRSSSTIRVLFIFQFLSPLCSSINRFFAALGINHIRLIPTQNLTGIPVWMPDCLYIFPIFLSLFPLPCGFFPPGRANQPYFQGDFTPVVIDLAICFICFLFCSLCACDKALGFRYLMHDLEKE